MRKNPSLNTVIKSLLNSIEELEYLELKLKGIYDGSSSDDSGFGGPPEERKVETKPAASAAPAASKPAASETAAPAAPAPVQQSEAGQRALDAMARNARAAITGSNANADARSGTGSGTGKDDGSFSIDLDLTPPEDEFDSAYKTFDPAQRKKMMANLSEKYKDDPRLADWQRKFQEQDRKIAYINAIGGDPSNPVYQRLLTGMAPENSSAQQDSSVAQGASSAREAISGASSLPTKKHGRLARLFGGRNRDVMNLENEAIDANTKMAQLQARLDNPKNLQDAEDALDQLEALRQKSQSRRGLIDTKISDLDTADTREDEILSERYGRLAEKYKDNPKALEQIQRALRKEREANKTLQRNAARRNKLLGARG